MCEITIGILHIHSKDILHCAINENNIFLAASGSTKIGNFHISKIMYNPTTHNTMAFIPIYMHYSSRYDKDTCYNNDWYMLGTTFFRVLYPQSRHIVSIYDMKLILDNDETFPETIRNFVAKLISKAKMTYKDFIDTTLFKELYCKRTDVAMSLISDIKKSFSYSHCVLPKKFGIKRYTL